MIQSIIGLLVIVMVTTLTAGLVQLSVEVLAPKRTLTPSQKAVVKQYRNGLLSPPTADLVEADIVKMLCELPRQTNGVSQPGC